MKIEEIWFKKSLVAGCLRVILLPLSWLYGLSWQVYLWLYQWGIKHPHEPHFPVICIGNLVVGGSGKSPLTLFSAQCLKELNEAVVIGCSGYGGPHSEGASLAPDGPLDPQIWGDEPAMIRWLAPEFPLVVGRNRVLAAELVAQAHPEAILLMDDGFQHLPLKKHFTIVIDEIEPANRWTLPAGPYREPRSNRKRADLILPSAGFKIRKGPLTFIDDSGIGVAIESQTQILCAIGRPDQLIETISAVSKVEKTFIFPDHDDLQAGNLLECLDSSLVVTVTAKDWVKIRQRPDINRFQWRIALLPTTIEPKDEWMKMLSETLHQLRQKQTHSASVPNPSSPKP